MPLGVGGMAKVLSLYYGLDYPTTANLCVDPYLWNTRTQNSLESQCDHFNYLLEIFEDPKSDLHINIIQNKKMYEDIGKSTLIKDGKTYTDPKFDKNILHWKLNDEVYYPIKLKASPPTCVTIANNPATYLYDFQNIHHEDVSHLRGKIVPHSQLEDLYTFCRNSGVDVEWTGFFLPIRDAINRVLESKHFTYQGCWCWFLSNIKHQHLYILGNADTQKKYNGKYISTFREVSDLNLF